MNQDQSQGRNRANASQTPPSTPQSADDPRLNQDRARTNVSPPLAPGQKHPAGTTDNGDGTHKWPDGSIHDDAGVLVQNAPAGSAGQSDRHDA